MDFLANDIGKRGATGNKTKHHRNAVDKKSGMHRRRKYTHAKGKRGNRK
jgi:hypothetical protein